MATPRIGLTKNTASTTLADRIVNDDANIDAMDDGSALYLQDDIASRPAAGIEGRYFWSIDESLLYYDDGAAWHCVAAGSATQGSLPYVDAATKYALLAPGTAHYPLVSGGAGANPGYESISEILDALIGSTRGGLLCRGAGGWVLIEPDTAGYVLTDGGAGADPAWANPGYASGSVSVEVPFDDADGEVTLLTMPANGFIRFVGKVVTTAYDNGSVTAGEDGDESNLMTAAVADAQGTTNDIHTPNKYYASGSVIKAFITPQSEIDLYTTPEIVGNAASGGAISIASKIFEPIDCSGLTKANGTLSIDVKYVGDALNHCMLEITSSGTPDNEEWATEISSLIIQDGDYHTYEFPLATWLTTGGEMDPSEIDHIRIYGGSESGDAQFWWKNAKIMMNTTEGVFTLILEYVTV